MSSIVTQLGSSNQATVKQTLFAVTSFVASLNNYDHLFSVVFVFNIFDHLQECMHDDTNSNDIMLLAIKLIDQVVKRSR